MVIRGNDFKDSARLPFGSSSSWLDAASNLLGGSRGPVMRSRKQVMVEIRIVSGVFLAAIVGVIVLWFAGK